MSKDRTQFSTQPPQSRIGLEVLLKETKVVPGFRSGRTLLTLN